MTFSEITKLCPGTPVRVDGERVYFRSARISPHSGTALAIVADIAGGVFAAEVEGISREEDEASWADASFERFLDREVVTDEHGGLSLAPAKKSPAAE